MYQSGAGHGRSEAHLPQIEAIELAWSHPLNCRV